MPWNQLACVCEWIAPKRPPPPTAERTTSGALRCSFDRYQYLADWLTSESMARPMKSPNMISMIGRSPVTAAPKAAPVMASSEIGVSNTRLVAEALLDARRDREHAALLGGDVLAEEHDGLVALHLLDDRLADGDPELELVAHAANSVGVLGGGIGIRRGQSGLHGMLDPGPGRTSRPRPAPARRRPARRGAPWPRSAGRGPASARPPRAGGTWPDRPWSARGGGRSGTRAGSARRPRARARPPPARPPAPPTRRCRRRSGPGCRTAAARAVMSPPAVTLSIGVNSP